MLDLLKKLSFLGGVKLLGIEVASRISPSSTPSSARDRRILWISLAIANGGYKLSSQLSRIAGIQSSCRLPLMSTNSGQVIVPPVALNSLAWMRSAAARKEAMKGKGAAMQK